MELNNKHEINGSYTQYGFNMDEIISKSKVAASYNKSRGEIEEAQNIELQKINDIVINENQNLIELNQKCETFNLRNEKKLQIALKSQSLLINDMIQVTESFIKLKGVIEELEANKTITTGRQNEINILWKAVNDIQYLEIPEINQKLRQLNEDIQNVQSTNRNSLAEKKIFELEQNKIIGNISSSEEVLSKLKNESENIQHEFVIETNKNLKITKKRDELETLIQEKSNHVIEMKQKFEKLCSDTLGKIKSEFENELEKQNLIKINVENKIAADRASDTLQLQKANYQWEEIENNLKLTIEQLKNKRDEMRKSIASKNNERVKEEKLMMEKIQKIEVLQKRKLDLNVLLQENQLKNNNIDVICRTDEEQIQFKANEEVRELFDKIQAMELKNNNLRKELDQQTREKFNKRILLPERLQTKDVDLNTRRTVRSCSSHENVVREKFTTRSNKKRLDSQNKRRLENDSDDISFLSNISFDSEMNQSSISKFKLPSGIFNPLEHRNKKIKTAGIPKPKHLVRDLSSSDDSS